MNTCRKCKKRSQGELCYSCLHGHRHHMKKKDDSIRYCQNRDCPKRGVGVDINTMVKLRDMMFCSKECRDAFKKHFFYGEDTDIEN
jgi:hypothetical protein